MDIKTITGKTWEQVRETMTAILPPDAYSKVEGARADLTDINPAYLTEVLDEVFGPCGFGWWFEYDEVTVVDTGESRRWLAAIDRMQFYYLYVTQDGETRVSQPILSNGGSQNSERQYAVRGAITNAIGGAASKLLWQINVYKGKLNHRNAKAKAKQTKTEAAPDPPENGVDKPKAGSAAVKPEPEAKASGNGRDEALAAAMATVIPFGKHRDKPLGELIGDPNDHEYVGWLAGEVEFAGKTFEPRYGTGQQLAAAAQAVYASLQEAAA